jgi:glycosyltransferase involved in cell wall biosynthesis
MPDQLVSIVIPTFNRARFLECAIRSALAQSGCEVEVIVCDNASSDDTQQVIQCQRDPRLRPVRQVMNIGMFPNWNVGLREAKGELVVFLSDDDYLDVAMINRAARLIVDDDTVGAVYCRSQFVDQHGAFTEVGKDSPEFEPAPSFVIEWLKGNRSVVSSGIMWRSEDLRAIGGFDGVVFSLPADIAALFRVVLRRGRIAFAKTALVNYTRHEGNETRTVDVHRWGQSFVALGDLCYSEFVAMGNERAAHAARRLCTKIGVGYVRRSITQRMLKGASRKVVFMEMWGCRRYFKGAYGVLAVCRMCCEMVLPRRLLGEMGRVRRAIRIRKLHLVGH